MYIFKYILLKICFSGLAVDITRSARKGKAWTNTHGTFLWAVSGNVKCSQLGAQKEKRMEG